jgi:hypothetical protein
MEEKSIITNLIPALIFTLAFEGAFISGLLTAGNPILVALVFPVLYCVFYFIRNANRIDFPLYFFIAMTFGNANDTIVTENMIQKGLLFSTGILILVTLKIIVQSLKKKLPMVPTCGIKHSISEKYQKMFENDPRMSRRILVHTLILFISGIVGYFLAENHGYWVLITCGAVFIGDEFKVLKKRGLNLIFGLILGSIIVSLIAYFHIPSTIRTLIFVSTIFGASRIMPKVEEKPNLYIIGSSMVAVMIMIGASMNQTYLTNDIVFDRLLCGFIGIFIAITSTDIFNRLNKGIYQNVAY